MKKNDPAPSVIPDIVIITGMSGSGRTQALHVFEDMGYFCIDNLPPALILQLSNLVGINTGVGRHLAVTCDLRSQGLFDDISEALKSLSDHELTYKVVYLDSSDEVLMRRYSENRRRHPLAQEGENLSSAISRERAQLQDIKALADVVLDTSSMRTNTLKSHLRRAFSELAEQQLMDVSVFSFGFKNGLPVEADLMIDVRFLPNPYYDPELRPLTGLDEPVAQFVLKHGITKKFLKSWFELLDVVMPGYVQEGKSLLSIAVGCTGGQRRRIPGLPIICDPSHIGGRRDLIAPLCQQAMDLGFDGLIVESHCTPEKAWSDAEQQVTPDILDYILSLLVVRDHASTTEGLRFLRAQIDEIDNSLMGLLSKRFRICREIGTFKKEHNMTILQAGRYGEILEKRGAQASLCGMDANFAAQVFELIHEESVRQQLEVVNK